MGNSYKIIFDINDKTLTFSCKIISIEEIKGGGIN